jgi:hypothetical protein
MIIYYHVAVVLVWLNTVVKQDDRDGVRVRVRVRGVKKPICLELVAAASIGLRGVFQYCVTQYLIVWPFLGVFPFSTVLAVSENMTFECKRSRSRTARHSFYIIFVKDCVSHMISLLSSLPLMIGEIPISDACHYGCT